jgi:two-component system cell cycle response regulator DivK
MKLNTHSEIYLEIRKQGTSITCMSPSNYDVLVISGWRSTRTRAQSWIQCLKSFYRLNDSLIVSRRSGKKGPCSMKKKILVVEDNDDLRAILILRLTHMGYQAIEAKSSKEAITCAESEQPALIFMDVGLPDCDGIKTSAILKQNKKTSQIPIVALTAWMSELSVAKASRVGIKTYLLKPGSAQTLKETIEKFTAKRLPEEMT